MTGGVTTTIDSQNQLLLNVTPPVIDVITDVTTVDSQDQVLLNVTPPAIDVIIDVTGLPK
jgi:hypothetical protein